MAENSQILTEEQTNTLYTLIQYLVDTMAKGNPKEIANELQKQYVDRSSLYDCLNIAPGNTDALEILPDIKQIVKNVSETTRKELKLSYPDNCYSDDDPINHLYTAMYHFVSVWVIAIMQDETAFPLFLDAMTKAGIDGNNIDDFLHTEFSVVANLQNLPAIAEIQKENPDYQDFNKAKPGNYRYLDARKKLEHTYQGKIVETESLDRGGEQLENGQYAPLNIEDHDMIQDITTKLCVQQCAKFLTDKEKEILSLRLNGETLEAIAEKLGYHDASGVKKAMTRIAEKLKSASVI